MASRTRRPASVAILSSVLLSSCAGSDSSQSPCEAVCSTVPAQHWHETSCSEDTETVGGVKVADGDMVACAVWMDA